MYLLGLRLAELRGTLPPERLAELVAELKALPSKIEETLAATEEPVRAIAAQPQRAGLLPLPRPPHRPAGLPRGGAEAEGDLLHPHRRLRGRRDEARPDRPARRVDAGGLRRHRQPGPGEGALQRRGGARPRRPDDRDRHRGRRAGRRGRRRDDRGRRAPTGSCSRSSRSCRCSCSPTTSPAPAASTSTSPATWPRPSRSSEVVRTGSLGCPRSVKLRLVLPVLLAAPRRPPRRRLRWRQRQRQRHRPGHAWRRPKSPLFVEATVQPEGETKTNIEALAKEVAGIDDLGGLIVSKNSKTRPPTKAKNSTSKRKSSPGWAKRAGSSSQEYEGDDFDGYGVAIQVDRRRRSRRTSSTSRSKSATNRQGRLLRRRRLQGPRTTATTVGVFDELRSSSPKTKRSSSRWSTPPNGESLGGEDAFTERDRQRPRRQRRRRLRRHRRPDRRSRAARSTPKPSSSSTASGSNPRKRPRSPAWSPAPTRSRSTSAANLSGENPPSGDASELLGSLPGDLGRRLRLGRIRQALQRRRSTSIDEQGIPGQVPPHQLKKALKQAGIDLEAIASSIGDVGVFVTGNSESSLGGAVVLEAEEPTAGEEHRLQPRPLPARQPARPASPRSAARQRLLDPQRRTRPPAGGRRRQGQPDRDRLRPRRDHSAWLQEVGQDPRRHPAYKEAVSALGSTPIAAFVDGPSALNLATALVPSGRRRLRGSEAVPARRSATWRSAPKHPANLAIAKLIVGVGK